jgi:ABC-type glycerol-3-phosphate transport system substrate-binding protein
MTKSITTTALRLLTGFAMLGAVALVSACSSGPTSQTTTTERSSTQTVPTPMSMPSSSSVTTTKTQTVVP